MLSGMVLGRQTITLGTRKARAPAAKVLCAPEWPCPAQAGPKWPKITKNRPWCLRGAAQKVPLSKLMDKSTWVLFGLPFGCVWTHVAPKRCPLGPKWVHLGPESVLRGETEKWPYLRLDGQNRESVDTFPMCKPPL